MKKYAVVGVTESVGREVLSYLSEQGVKPENVVALESRSALGNMVSYGEEDELDVVGLDGYDFKGVTVAVFASSAEISKKYIPHALAKGVKVVDCSSAFFGQPDVPMIIAGFNDDKIAAAKRGLAAVPSADVTQMLIPLQNIHRNYQIKRIVVSDYTSASVYGKEAMDELFNQTRKIFMNDTLADDQNIFHKQIAFNVIPQVGEFIGDETGCEWAFNAETKAVLGGDVKVHANCAIVAAFIGCGQYINVECEKDIDVEDARKLIEKVPGVIVFDKHTDGGYVTVTDVQGEDGIYVSRLRQDTSVENGISLWCVADNLRVGVAKNALAVAELLASN